MRERPKHGWSWLVLLLLCGLASSCAGRSPTAPRADSQLEVFVQWEDRGVADRRLEIVELGVAQTTDPAGIARFALPAGSYTLRAYVNVGGPAGFTDLSVTTRAGETERIEVADCLPCLSAR